MTEAQVYRDELMRRLSRPVRLLDCGVREPTPREQELRAVMIYLHEGPPVFMRDWTGEKIIKAMVAYRFPDVEMCR